MPTLEADEQIEVPRNAGHALKAFAAGRANEAQQKLAYDFILTALSGVDRSSFVHGDDTGMVLAWREGRRFVGRNLRRIVEAPMPTAEDDAPAARPAMRTTTDVVEEIKGRTRRRRGKG